MQPARFKVTDAVFNIGTAIGAVQSLPPGVYLAMNGQIFDPARFARTSKRTASRRSPEKVKPPCAAHPEPLPEGEGILAAIPRPTQHDRLAGPLLVGQIDHVEEPA